MPATSAPGMQTNPHLVLILNAGGEGLSLRRVPEGWQPGGGRQVVRLAQDTIGNGYRVLGPKDQRKLERLYARMIKAAGRVRSFEQHWEDFFGRDVAMPNEPSLFARQALAMTLRLQPVLRLMHDGHAHQSDYGPREGDLCTQLALQMDPYAEALFCGVCPLCGNSHYSDANSGSPSYTQGPELDRRHIAEYRRLRDEFHGWVQLMEEVAAFDPKLAHQIDRAALERNRGADALRAGLAQLRQLDLGLAARVTVREQNVPHKILSIHLALTGFNPADRRAARYIAEQKLTAFDILESVGEVPLLKEAIDQMLKLQHEHFSFDDPDHRAALYLWLSVVTAMDLAGLVHSDLGSPQIGEDGRLLATDDHNYDQFDGLAEALAPFTAPGSNSLIKHAHTGVGRFVEPDLSLIDNPFPPLNGYDYGPKIPVHVARLEELWQRCGGLLGEVSWLDNCRRIAIDPDYRRAMAIFVLRHPDAMNAGTDALRPVPAQLRQNTVALLGLAAEIGRHDQTAALRFLRKNLEHQFDAANTARFSQNDLDRMADRLKARADQLRRPDPGDGPMMRLRDLLGSTRSGWAAYELDAIAATIRTAKPSPAHPANDIIRNGLVISGQVVVHGRAQVRQLAEREFASLDFQAAAAVLDALDHAAEHVRPESMPPRPVRLPGADRLSGAWRGTPDPGDDVQGGTGAGYRWSAAKRGQVADFALMGAGAAAGLIPGVGPTATAGRQWLFHRVIKSDEFDRLCWEEIFENGQITKEALDLFVNRVITAAKGAGVDADRIRGFLQAMAQLRANASYVYGRAREMSDEQKAAAFEALMAMVGVAQRDGDVALGLQAATFSKYDARIPKGRANNAMIAATSAASTTGALSTTWAVLEHLELSGIAETAAYVTSGSAVILAIGTQAIMATRALLANRKGRANLNPEFDQRFAKLQERVLTGIELTAGAGAAQQAVLMIAPGGNLWIQTAHVAIDLGIGITADLARRMERKRAEQLGTPWPEDKARTNNRVLGVLTADAASSGVMSQREIVQWMNEVADLLRRLNWP